MQEIKSLSFYEVMNSMALSCRLLLRHPVRFSLMTVLLLVCVESLMLLPVIGFSLKIALAGLLMGQFILLLALAEQGQTPGVFGLLKAFKLPLMTQMVLMLFALIVFFGGLSLLLPLENREFFSFFFSRLGSVSVPGRTSFMHFKIVMILLNAGFFYVSATLVLYKLPISKAIGVAMKAALINWKVLIISILLNFSVELLQQWLVDAFSLPVSSLIVAPIILLLVMWTISFHYVIARQTYTMTLAVKV